METSPDKQVIVITREYDYPVELVWKAWTDPTLLMRWWGPTHYTSPRCEVDLREGGKYVFGMRAPASNGGAESYSAGVYTKIVPMERLEFTSFLSDRDGNPIAPAQAGVPSDFPNNIDFVVEFVGKDGRTELRITEYGWTAGEMMKYAVMGMNQSLDKLAVSLIEM